MADVVEDYKAKYEELLDEVTSFSKVRQELLRAKSKLNQEVSKYEIITRFNKESLTASTFEEAATLALECIIEAFEYEFAIFLRKNQEGRLEVVDSFSIEVPDEFTVELGEKIARQPIYFNKEINRKEHWVELGIKEGIAGPVYSVDQEIVGVIVTGITDENEGYYDPVKEEHLLSFSVFLQQIGAIKHMFSINETLESKVQERTIELLRQKEEITDSINYALQIQNSILGDTTSITSRFKDSFIFYVPKDIVSGDFYWFSEINKLKVIIAADCTGHGVPGAFMTVLGNALLNEIVNDHFVMDPGKILTVLDKKIRSFTNRGHQVNDGMDISVLVFDDEYQVVRFAGAKNPLIHISAGEVIRIKGSRSAIGGEESNKHFETHQIDYTSGDSFYIFSDGFQDQFCKDDCRKFKTKPFYSLLNELSQSSGEQQLERLKSEFYSWKGNTPQTDDVLVIGIQV